MLGYGVCYMNRELAQKGIRTLATIKRIASARSSEDATYFTLTIEWTTANGQTRSSDQTLRCDLGDLPQVGDQVEMTYLKDVSLIELHNPTGMLRRDQLPSRGNA